MKTRAAVCRAFGQPLSLEEVELAEPGEGEIRVKIEACAICHSDLFYIDGSWGGDLPAVFGHEAAGVVEAVGPGVGRVKPGERVVATLIRSCGGCASCSGGAPVFCDEVFPLDRKSPITNLSGEPIGHGMRIGAFAEHVVVHHSQVAPIPASLPFDVASLIACGVLTGFGAVVNTAKVGAGESVVVIGCGGVGLNAVQGARIAGASPVVALDVAATKLEAAKAFGASHALDARAPDLIDQVKAACGGALADHVFVTVGAPGVAEQAISLMRRNGAVVLVGMPASGVKTSFDPGWLAGLGQRIIGSKMGSARLPVDVPRLVALYEQGRLKLDELVSARFPFARINDALAASRGGAALRNVVTF